MIGIVNYGVGNIRSVRNAVSWTKGESILIDRAAQFEDVSGILLPGVGAFVPAAKTLESNGLADALRDWALVRQRPIFGICLGMQLLAEWGNEGGRWPGLGLVPAEVVRLTPSAHARVPHVGWNRVRKRRDSPLWEGLEQATCYFVHSYQLQVGAGAEDLVTGTVEHGGPVTAMVERGNVMGAQFHPEKSQADGLAILANFIRLAERW